MKPSTRYTREVRERAVGLVLDQQSEHDSQWSGRSDINTAQEPAP